MSRQQCAINEWCGKDDGHDKGHGGDDCESRHRMSIEFVVGQPVKVTCVCDNVPVYLNDDEAQHLDVAKHLEAAGFKATT